MELSIPVARKETIAENTYLLTLDGDIDFQPNAVELLVDLMKKNKNLGAACGRIHPVGSGLSHSLYYTFMYYTHLYQNKKSFFYIYYFCTRHRSHGLVSNV
jgi:hypothetical protein